MRDDTCERDPGSRVHLVGPEDTQRVHATERGPRPHDTWVVQMSPAPMWLEVPRPRGDSLTDVHRTAVKESRIESSSSRAQIDPWLRPSRSE